VRAFAEADLEKRVGHLEARYKAQASKPQL
jgi:hypothetical protein